jgi:D-beta-D-heptose 7-phosphate kinase/D-beta-D-heptose 1-phosphate adenosyltransferase
VTFLTDPPSDLDPSARVLSWDALADRFGRPRAGRLVFTNGVFDILHRGHVDYLARARALGDALVVGLNSDASVRRLDKGPERPLVGERDRAFLLASLRMVDAVVLFDEDTPARLIEHIVPDVLVKGGDYSIENVVGRDTVEAAGGEVRIIRFVDGFSTTSLIEKIRRGV